MEKGRNYLLDILILIDKLQKNTFCNDNNSCTRPILGLNNNLVYNTRPVSFYLCNNQELTIDSCNVFRVESIDNSCITVRLLNVDEQGDITSTGEFATVSINCIAAIRCLNDISLTI